jgi:hypothetical protein
MARTAATTTGKRSGLSPAITALAASFSTVASPKLGGIAPRDSPEGRPQADTIADAAERVRDHQQREVIATGASELHASEGDEGRRGDGEGADATPLQLE